ncbi:MAG TPA: phosphoglycerate kinase [Nitrososphaeraceae archaeon]|jgi:phosphoglycerate kinase
MIQTVSDLNDLKFYGKKVLTRVDFNVTLNDDIIGEDYRIRMTIPTIEYLTKRGAKVILMSHLGRPKPTTTNSPITDRKYSLAPVAKRLSEILLVNKVTFATNCIGQIAQKKIDDMHMGDVLLLENLRFHREEETNNSEFCKQLASLADVYVNDAFSSSHRKHASTYGTPKLFDTRVGGLTLKKEVEYLSMIRDNPTKPFTLIVGGVKIKDKIGALENLLPKADSILVGGATAYTFLKANGTNIGNSPVDDEHLNWVTNALSKYRNKIILPTDHIVSRAQDSPSVSLVKGDIPDGMIGFDIGIETSQQYSNQIAAKRSGTTFWNGPMGLFELKHFANGTNDIARTMALSYWRGSKTLIGGGDTLEAMKRAGVSEGEVSHVSTGGGATLRFLAGDEMPGIDILQ